MSTKLLKVLILGATVVSALASASSASAWTTNGPGNFTATTGAARLTASPGPVINCSGPNNATGTLNAKSGAGSGLGLSTVTLTFAGCTVSGLPVTVVCSPPAEFNGTSYSAPVTTGTLSGIRCVFSIPNCTVTMTGTVGATYNNTTFKITILSAGQSLAYTASGSSCSALGFGASGVATLTNSSGGNLVYTVTSAFKPNITNP
jgi:hypothetical protein